MRKNHWVRFLSLVILLCLSVHAAEKENESHNKERTAHPSDCPSRIMKDFVGTWGGNAKILDPSGKQLKEENSQTVFAIDNCFQYHATIQYFDADGKLSRENKFAAEWSSEKKMFTTQGAAMDGIVRHIDGGTYLSSFTYKVPGLESFCDETINMLSSATPPEIVRTIQCFKNGKGGPLFNIRVMHETKKIEPEPEKKK